MIKTTTPVETVAIYAIDEPNIDLSTNATFDNGAGWIVPVPAMMTVEEAEAMAQARVAAALREVANLVYQYENCRTWADWASLHANVIALITDAGGALDRALREAEARGMERAAKIAKEIADQYVGYMSRIEAAIRAKTAAIRAQEEEGE